MALSDELRARVVAEFPKYPEKRAVLLTALHWVQAERGGWIPPDTIPDLAELLEIPVIEVEEVISFYPMYSVEPVGRWHLQVCTNLPCCLAGARGLVRALEHELDICAGEVSEDGMFSLRETECLGSCGTAPVLQVNNEPYVECLTEGGLVDLIARLRARAAAADAAQTASKTGASGTLAPGAARPLNGGGS
ncbi:MAG TPA: NAD(P)H-dependent oxidoreductase subunit E [Candidatus Binatia bacterium]|nr:NAD(P)H-dependent oxidoreductase subunit E [Candidatus Binatia bacterium]